MQILASWLAANLKIIIETIFKWLANNWIFTMSCALTTIICLIYQTIKNPEGALNQFMIMVLSSVLILFPSTPDNLKVGSLLSQFAAAFPQIGTCVLGEILSGIAGLAAVFLVVKLWRLMPFI